MATKSPSPSSRATVDVGSHSWRPSRPVVGRGVLDQVGRPRARGIRAVAHAARDIERGTGDASRAHQPQVPERAELPPGAADAERVQQPRLHHARVEASRHPLPRPRLDDAVVGTAERCGEQRAVGGEQQRGRQHLLQRRLLEQRIDHPQRIALEGAHARRALGAGSAVMLVMHHGLRREPDLVAEHPQPPPELDVLVIGKRRLVPTAAGFEDIAAKQHRGAASEQQRTLFEHDFLDRQIVALREAAAFEVDQPAGEVHALACPVDDERTNRGGVAAIRHVHHRVQPIGFDSGVVVQEHQPVAGGDPRAGVVAAGEAQVLPRAHHPHARVVGASDGGGIVGGTVVHHDHFRAIGGPGVLPQRVETLRQVRGAAGGQHHDRHQRFARRRDARSRSQVRSRTTRCRRG